MLRHVEKYLLHLRGVPSGEGALQGGALEAQPQRALLCRGARQALTTLRTTLAHKALHATCEDHAALLRPSCLILQWHRWVRAMPVHWADPHRPVRTDACHSAHIAGKGCSPIRRDSHARPGQTHTRLRRCCVTGEQQLALQGPCCEKCAVTEAWASRMQVS